MKEINLNPTFNIDDEVITPFGIGVVDGQLMFTPIGLEQERIIFWVEFHKPIKLKDDTFKGGAYFSALQITKVVCPRFIRSLFHQLSKLLVKKI